MQDTGYKIQKIQDTTKRSTHKATKYKWYTNKTGLNKIKWSENVIVKLNTSKGALKLHFHSKGTCNFAFVHAILPVLCKFWIQIQILIQIRTSIHLFVWRGKVREPAWRIWGLQRGGFCRVWCTITLLKLNLINDDNEFGAQSHC